MVKQQIRRQGIAVVVAFVAIAALLFGCVTKETYQAQVKRANNLQRLLADEEKKRNEETRNLRRQVRDLETRTLEFESKNRELSAQFVAIQEENSRMQEELEFLQLQPAPIPEFQEQSLGFDAGPSMEPMPTEKKFGGLEEEFLGTADRPVYHEVVRGDTLWNIAQRNGTKIQTIKQFNGLTGDTIYIGQRLIVRYE